MNKLHYCGNGATVTDQVMKFQKHRKHEDASDYFVPIQKYYDDYRDQWFGQLEDYMDRQTFDGEFDFKLIRAVDTFNNTTSKQLADKYGWSDIGRFNRWFFKILTNWKSNVKNSSFRLKKRPAVQCPVCGKSVPRITKEHLQHYKTTSMLPKFIVYKGNIYEVCSLPRVYATTWGEKTTIKLNALKNNDFKTFAKSKRRCRWPWKMRDGSRGVLCPFTRKIVPEISDEYIHNLPIRYGRYATPISWEEFVEQYPTTLIQSEVYSLDFELNHSEDTLKDFVQRDYRSTGSAHFMDYEKLCRQEISVEFEHVFYSIDNLVNDEIDRDILRLLAIGYTAEDIADTLHMDRKEVRNRMRRVRDSNKDLEKVLKG